jgi:hypothetical protein
MYRITKPGYRKSDQDKRWALPDRIFFACGACHILAHAFLEKWGDVETKVLWIKPAPGFTGNHIVIDGGDWIFDYHGYSIREVFLSHTFRKARRWWPGFASQDSSSTIRCHAPARTCPDFRHPRRSVISCGPLIESRAGARDRSPDCSANGRVASRHGFGRHPACPDPAG